MMDKMSATNLIIDNKDVSFVELLKDHAFVFELLVVQFKDVTLAVMEMFYYFWTFYRASEQSISRFRPKKQHVLKHVWRSGYFESPECVFTE